MPPISKDAEVYKDSSSANEKVNQKVNILGRMLKLCPMEMESEKERFRKGYTCSTLEVHVGRDGRHYFLNLAELMPLQGRTLPRYLQFRFEINFLKTLN